MLSRHSLLLSFDCSSFLSFSFGRWFFIKLTTSQLRENTMVPETRRLVRLTLESKSKADEVLDMLLAKKRAGDRRIWLEKHGDQAGLN